ncbi:uncharacterized protein F5891DRAFT_977985 [Suillus fuscotomentosus]|uniref:Uncharacterized protein n=1 Tax=Suillus fuscotomentosus TaxID=1912939 RepID=A0AAD4ECE9_9AGAM|nr:uncharacterized protein F5891DRAFT_977985 [Suillus fuscotomentosus]KAG1903422.1 hypothetical protein F5891DRAFT_977985 [Suillus fuscotomentosus]
MPEADIPGKKKGQGCSTWATRTKFKFLDACATEWQESLDNNSSTSFYTSVTRLWVKKYGWYFDYWSDLEEDIEDPADDDLDFADGADGKEELTKCNNYFDVMHVWYHHHYRKAQTAITNNNMEMALNTLGNFAPKPPRKPRILQFYSANFYNDCIKHAAEFEIMKKLNEYKVQLREWERMWRPESQNFRDEVETKMKEEHRIALEAYESGVQVMSAVTPTAQDYHNNISQAAAFLQPLADAIQKQFGMATSILMVGPIPSLKGRIEMRSVHSGATNAALPQLWPQFDPDRFTAVSQSMVKFGEHVFSNIDEASSDCVARALSSSPIADNEDPSVNAPVDHITPTATVPPASSTVRELSSSHILTPEDEPQCNSQEGSSNAARNTSPPASLSDITPLAPPTITPEVSPSIVGSPPTPVPSVDSLANPTATVPAEEPKFDLSGKSIPLTKCPKDFKIWFHGSRKDFLPKNFNEFVSGMVAWWTAIQPDDRECDSQGAHMRETQDADWSRLRKAGRNGMYLIVVGLMWWHNMISNNKTMGEWLAIVEDVSWVLESMVATHIDECVSPTPSPPSPLTVHCGKCKITVVESTNGVSTRSKRARAT